MLKLVTAQTKGVVFRTADQRHRRRFLQCQDRRSKLLLRARQARACWEVPVGRGGPTVWVVTLRILFLDAKSVRDPIGGFVLDSLRRSATQAPSSAQFTSVQLDSELQISRRDGDRAVTRAMNTQSTSC